MAISIAITPTDIKSLAVTSSSGSVTFTTGINAQQLMFKNLGASTCYVRWGVGAQTAVTTDLPIAAGEISIYTKGFADTVAAVTSSGTATLSIIAGEGN